MKSFVFVGSGESGKVKPEDRGKVRSHSMLGKNKRVIEKPLSQWVSYKNSDSQPIKALMTSFPITKTSETGVTYGKKRIGLKSPKQSPETQLARNKRVPLTSTPIVPLLNLPLVHFADSVDSQALDILFSRMLSAPKFRRIHLC